MDDKKPLQLKYPSPSDRCNTYLCSKVMYAHYKQTPKGYLSQLTRFTTCREELAGAIFNHRDNRIRSKQLLLLVRNIVSSISLDKHRRGFEKMANGGLRIINIMEARHSWPLTVMHDVADITNSTSTGGHYRRDAPRILITKALEASPKWIRSPHMVSLYALLFRLPFCGVKFINIKDYDGLRKACEFCAKSNTGDGNQVRQTWRFWDPIMANSDDIFRGVPFAQAFDKEQYTRSCLSEGVLTLCQQRTSNTKIQSKFTEVMKQVGLY